MNTSILGIKMLFLQQFNKIAVMDTIQIKDKRFTPFIPAFYYIEISSQCTSFLTVPHIEKGSPVRRTFYLIC